MGKYKSLTCAMLQEMSNGSWYTNKYLAQNYGWRFGGRLFNLRKYGVKFTKQKGEGYIELWKVDSIPKSVIYKNRNSLKIERLSLIEIIYTKIFG